MVEIIVNSETPLKKSRGNLEYDLEQLIEGFGEWAGGGRKGGWDIVPEIYDDAQAQPWLKKLAVFPRKWGVPADTLRFFGLHRRARVSRRLTWVGRSAQEGAMRAVIIFLRDTTEAAITAYLDASYPQQREPWIVIVNGDFYLYIDLYHAGPREHEPEQWANIVRQFGGEPAVAVIADVSGRHPGDEQVLAFVTALLTRFSGAAMDDYTDHLWSLAELRGGHRIAGHPFFDYNGWFAEQDR